MLLTVECLGCGGVTPQMPRACSSCGCQAFHVLTSAGPLPTERLELLELLEDPDLRPYSWENE